MLTTKTIKLEKGEYTNFSDEFDNHDIKILTGARGAGKSYPCAKHISKKLLADKEAKFIYMRNRDAELATFASWITDMDLEGLTGGCASWKVTRGQPTKGDIQLLGFNEEGAQCFSRILGKCISLESSHVFKSGKYSDVCAIAFEEYTHLKMAVGDEKRYVFNFLENVVSVFRDRKKDITLMSNNLKNIPLMDAAIEQLTGELFENPIKIKIFRKSSANKTNEFMAYLNGELFEDDDFKVNPSEFYSIYTNRDFHIMAHKIYPKKYYITANKNNTSLHYGQLEYMAICIMLRQAATNEFYYQNSGVERDFITGYSKLIAELSKFASDNGTRYIMA